MNYEAFISYRRADKEAAEQIFNTLTGMRHRVFFDTESLDAGDFADHIRKAIEESEMVVSILTCDSIRRMANAPETDMVRLELQECREKDKLVRFFWLCDSGKEGPQRDLYEMLGQYKDDAFFQWLLGQNITPFKGDEAGVRETCRLILKAVERNSQRLVLKVGDKEYVYYGETQVTWKGAAFPYGEGKLVENSGEDAFLIYEGKWETLFESYEPPMYIGTGTVYRQKRGGKRVKVYEGHWTDLLYDDQNGTLYADDGETVEQQGRFLPVKDSYGRLSSLYKPDGEVPRIVAYAEGGDVPLFRGEAVYGGWEIKALAYGQGEVRAPDGCVFTGHFDKNRNPQWGELRIPCADSFHVYRGQVRERPIEASFSFQPFEYGRMEYADGSSYEGFWELEKWSALGVAVIHTPRFDIRIEGSFGHDLDTPIYGGYPDGDTRELRISLRRQGETDFRLVYYAPESSDRTAVPYRISGIGTFYYTDGSRYEGEWDSRDGKKMDWKKNIAGHFFAADGAELHPDSLQLLRYEREERAVFDPLWSWAPDKPIQKARPVEPVLWKLIDDLLIPTQQFLGGTVTKREDLFRVVVSCLSFGSKEIEDIVLPPELMDMDFASLEPQRLAELLDAEMPKDSQWKKAGGDSKDQLRAMALVFDLSAIVPVLADYARKEAKHAQETEKKADPASKPADGGSSLLEDALDSIRLVLDAASYPYSREKVLLFLNTADNDVCQKWRALPEDEAQKALFLQVHAVEIGTDMATAGA